MEKAIKKPTQEEIEEYPLLGFMRNGRLTGKKLAEYVPVLIMTNFASLILSSCDGIILGNLVGSEALASVSIFSPVSTFVTLLSVLSASGIATALSNSMGESDTDKVDRTKSASNIIMVVCTILTAVIEVPVVYFIISSYGLSDDMSMLVWQYAIGLMISYPPSVVSNVGVYQLQVIGKMKVVMALAAAEGILNILFDIFFIKYMDLGVAGAGYGTAVSCTLRCIATVIIIWKTTDLYRTSAKHASLSEIMSVLRKGLPDTANSLMLAFQNYFMIMIILSVLGESGATVKGVIAFSVSVANVFITSVQSSLRSVASVYNGTEDNYGMHYLMRQCLALVTVLAGILTAVCLIYPKLFYDVYGVSDIPEGGLFMLRLASAQLVFKGLNTIIRVYFSNKNIIAFSTALTIIGNALLPVFTLGISKVFPSSWIWLAYAMTEIVMLAVNLIRYTMEKKKDIEQDEGEVGVLYLSVDPEDADTASTEIGKYADEHDVDKTISDTICECVKEMVSNTVKTQKHASVSIQLLVRFGKESTIYMMLDDGKCVELDDDEDTKQLREEKYSYMESVAKSVKYQYILNMNQSILKF